LRDRKSNHLRRVAALSRASMESSRSGIAGVPPLTTGRSSGGGGIDRGNAGWWFCAGGFEGGKCPINCGMSISARTWASAARAHSTANILRTSSSGNASVPSLARNSFIAAASWLHSRFSASAVSPCSRSTQIRRIKRVIRVISSSSTAGRYAGRVFTMIPSSQDSLPKKKFIKSLRTAWPSLPSATFSALNSPQCEIEIALISPRVMHRRRVSIKMANYSAAECTDLEKSPPKAGSILSNQIPKRDLFALLGLTAITSLSPAPKVRKIGYFSEKSPTGNVKYPN
jgi:hypothetical protein